MYPLRSTLRGALANLLCFAVGLASAAPLTIAMPDGPVSLPLYVAFEKRLFEAEGLEAVAAKCASGKACLSLLRSGAADVAASAEFTVAMTDSLKPAVAIVGSISDSAVQIRVLANRAAGINDVTGISGKRVATVKETSAQYFLDRWLIYQGIDPSRIELIFAEPGALGGMLQKKTVAAIAVWEPEASKIEELLGSDAVRLPAALVYKQHFCLSAKAAAIGQDRSRYERLLRALSRAQEFIARSPADASAMLARHLGVSTHIAKRLMSEQDYRLTLHPSLPMTMLNQLRWRAGRQPGAGELSLAVPSTIRPLIDTSVLQAVDPNAVTLPR